MKARVGGIIFFGFMSAFTIWEHISPFAFPAEGTFWERLVGSLYLPWIYYIYLIPLIANISNKWWNRIVFFGILLLYLYSLQFYVASAGGVFMGWYNAFFNLQILIAILRTYLILIGILFFGGCLIINLLDIWNGAPDYAKPSKKIIMKKTMIPIYLWE